MALPEIKTTMDFVEIYHNCWQAQQLQQSLAAQIEQIIADTGTDMSPFTRTTLLSMQNNLTALASSHTDAVAPIPNLLKSSPQSSILATKVFGTTELLENIFSNLEACDILSAYSINKAF